MLACATLNVPSSSSMFNVVSVRKVRLFAPGEALAGTLGRGGVPASGDVARFLGAVCRRTHVGFRRDLLHHLAATLEGTADVPRRDARSHEVVAFGDEGLVLVTEAILTPFANL